MRCTLGDGSEFETGKEIMVPILFRVLMAFDLEIKLRRPTTGYESSLNLTSPARAPSLFAHNRHSQAPWSEAIVNDCLVYEIWDLARFRGQRRKLLNFGVRHC